MFSLQNATDSRTIAIASKRDSSVMKSISLLTMVFLPGTFISVSEPLRQMFCCFPLSSSGGLLIHSQQTLFAMPLFNWNASRISDIASPHTWLYLAAALPLTLIITMCWLIWLRWNRWLRHKEAREEALELGFTDEETREEKAIEGPKDMKLIEAKPSSI